MTTTATIDPTLIAAIPEGVSIEQCEIAAARDLDIDGRQQIDDDATVVVLPGYVAAADLADQYYRDAETADEAAEEFAGTYERDGKTYWVRVWMWRPGLALDEDGDVVRLQIDREWRSIAIEPDEPECSGREGHDWQSPIEVVGGVKENPGVHGHGGGVIITEVCAHCGRYRITDTWAQDPETGEQGLESVEYRARDGQSERWITQRLLDRAQEACEECDAVVEYERRKTKIIATLSDAEDAEDAVDDLRSAVYGLDDERIYFSADEDSATIYVVL